MKIPKKPPSDDVFVDGKMTSDRFLRIVTGCTDPFVRGKYLHWDKLCHRTPPEGLSHVEWWQSLKFRRKSLYRPLPLGDVNGDPFKYLLADPILELLHQIDLGAGGLIQMPEQITSPETKDQYYISSLIDEATTSSQLEGASTTRPVAREMIRSGRPPRDNSERMIMNNYLAMKRIGAIKNQPLSKELVFELHRIVTNDTLDDSTASGRFRRDDEIVRVEDNYGTVFHEPPPARQLERRMEEMCDFANGETPDGFLYPALRSIILHFWLSYDHPFKDGNGRTARALFYWSMLHHKYWLCEYISISQIIRKAPTKYGRAFLYTETDDNDLTYFILYHVEVIRRAIRELHEYIQRKAAELQRLEAELRGVQILNHRQRALIGHAVRHPNQRYTIESHRVSHNVVYETARSDLMDLRDRGLLASFKVGKTWYFAPVDGLVAKLGTLAPI